MSTKQSMRQHGRALRQLTLGTGGKSAGRNSAGRITIFHRGGGAKRLHRTIDLKRSTNSIGIVERVEYDPNRSSWIAPVRWIEGVQLHQRKCNTGEDSNPLPFKILQPTATTTRGLFSYSSMPLPRKVDQSMSPGVMSAPSYATARLPPLSSKSPLPFITASKSVGAAGGKKKLTSATDVFFSALSQAATKAETASLSFPRIAVAGAKPTFFAPRIREKEVRASDSPLVIQKWNPHSNVWAHRIKRKAALSWQSFRQRDTLGLAGAAKLNESKQKTRQSSLTAKPKDGARKVERAPVTYIIASHQLEAGKMVMNCDWSKPLNNDSLRPAQHSHT